MVACGDTSTEWSYTAGIPQGNVWSGLLFNLSS